MPFFFFCFFFFLDSTVSVFVAFNGVWELENRDWIFRDAENQVLPVEKGVTYEQLLDILYDELEVDKCVHDLKIEVLYTCLSQSVKPTVIKNDRHVRAFIGLASKFVEKLIPLCVTLVKKGGIRNASASPSVIKKFNLKRKFLPHVMVSNELKVRLGHLFPRQIHTL